MSVRIPIATLPTDFSVETLVPIGSIQCGRCGYEMQFMVGTSPESRTLRCHHCEAPVVVEFFDPEEEEFLREIEFLTWWGERGRFRLTEKEARDEFAIRMPQKRNSPLPLAFTREEERRLDSMGRGDSGLAG